MKRLLTITLLGSTLVACSKSDADRQATARVVFAEGESARLERSAPTLFERAYELFVPSAHAQAGGAGGAASTSDPTCPDGAKCLEPLELGVKITAVYLAYAFDEAKGSYVGPEDESQPATQAVYASPRCPTYNPSEDGSAHEQLDFATCSIDVGLESSAGQEIVASPDFTDLAAGPAAVNDQLDAGTFVVAPGTYSLLGLETGSNAVDAPGNGNEATLPAGTAMNFRFRAEGMESAFEIRRLGGIDLRLANPLTVEEGDAVTLTLSFDRAGTILEVPEDYEFSGSLTEDACTPVSEGRRFCLDVSRISLTPSVELD